jgi:hypothetical protein
VNLEALIARSECATGEVDVVEGDGGSVPMSPEGGTVAIQRYEPEEVELQVETPEPATLILLDAFDPGWQAVLDGGEPVPIMRANGLVRAVPVPGGTHTVTFRDRTPWLTVGMWLSLIGTILCVVVLGAGARPRGGGTQPANGFSGLSPA